MSKVRFVSKEHADILRDYLSDSPAVILIMPEAHEAAEAKGIASGDNVDYVLDDAEHWVEVVDNASDAFFIDEDDD
jgi:hypothetical protein